MPKSAWNRWLSKEAYFWHRVQITSEDGCWLWGGAKDQDGYGCVSVGGRKQLKAHRAVWLYTHGDPKDLLVLHKCDNPPCCNPNHLFLGTTTDNMRDMAKKGRSLRGVRNPKNILSEKDVIAIRNAVAMGKHGVRTQLAKQYGVSCQTISYICYNGWKHI